MYTVCVVYTVYNNNHNNNDNNDNNDNNNNNYYYHHYYRSARYMSAGQVKRTSHTTSLRKNREHQHLDTPHVRVLQPLLQPALQTITKPQRLFSCRCS